MSEYPTTILFLQPCQRWWVHTVSTLSTWHWWPGRISFLGHMGLKQLEKPFLAGYHPKATVQTGDQYTSPVFLWKRTIYLSWSFSLGGTLQDYHTSRGYGSAFTECTPGECHLCTLSWPHHSLPLPPPEEPIHSSRAPIFASVSKGIIPLHHLVWRPFLKNCCLRV